MTSPKSRSRTDDPTPHRGGRPTREQATRIDRSVRERALELFLQYGYEGTSMNAIAEAAGTTKPSLYARFPTKEAVFRSVLEWAIQRTDWPVPEPPAPSLDDLEEALTAIASAALSRALEPSMIRLEQIAIAHASHYPELARRTFGTGFWPRKQLVVDLLNRHAADGSIVAEDPDLLAEHFLGMASVAPARLASFGIVHDPEDRARHTGSVVQLFLRSLRPVDDERT